MRILEIAARNDSDADPVGKSTQKNQKMNRRGTEKRHGGKP